jgi:hypothetical protein
MYAKFWSENLKGKDHSEDLGIDGKTQVGRCTLDSSGSGQKQVVDSCEHGNESSSSIKARIFLSDYKLLKKDSTPWC